MSNRQLLNTDEVCRKLSVSKDWFFRNSRSLIDLNGFPKAVTGFDRGSGKRWDPNAIDAWLDLQMAPALRDAHIARVHTDTADRIDWAQIGRLNAQRIARDLSDVAAE